MTQPRLKISILCASRSNPFGLRTCFGSLDGLASGKHDIQYVLGLDYDDIITKEAGPIWERNFHDWKDFKKEFRPWYCNLDDKRVALGTIWNDLAKTPSADLYALVTDRSVCTTPNWDIYLADAFSKDDTRVT